MTEPKPIITDVALTTSQQRAVTRLEGPLFVAAGAGSGKTAVVTHRFVHAIATGFASVDQILTITFTKKAAAEMMSRIRRLLKRALEQSGEGPERARLLACYRNIEQARISTIDSFCAGLLHTQALAAGLDPGFTAADETQAQIIRQEAFNRCVKLWASKHGAVAFDLIAAYDPHQSGALFNLVAGVYDRLRSRGQAVTLLPLPELDLHRAEERLKGAVRAALMALEEQGIASKSGERLQVDCGELLESLTEDDLKRSLEQGAAVKLARTGLTKVREELDDLIKARELYLTELRSLIAVETVQLLDSLLMRFDQEYSQQKRQRAMLDFADLSNLTRDLLRDNEDVRQRLSSRLKLIMVDEFQDTNPLQYEIIKLIARDNLFMVGDENQAIYGFRDAEVDLFRAENSAAQQAGYHIPLLENFRSQPEILAFVDRIFGGETMRLPGYLRLIAQAERVAERDDTRVELLLVDAAALSPASGKALNQREKRATEARLIARRLRQLFDEGSFTKDEAAILFERRRDVELYRDALDEAGIENYLGIGNSFFAGLELGDSINLLKVLVNPLDDLALLSVLRSPMVGVPDDCLYQLRRVAGEVAGSGRPIWPALKAGDKLNSFDPGSRVLLAGFVADLAAMRQASRRQPLAATVRRVINYRDYQAAVAVGFNGKQRLANLYKLADLAAEFESSWGRDLAAFVEFLQEQQAAQAREADAPVEEEGVQAVRLMTMHGAKGLEFPLVVLPKLGPGRGVNQSPGILLERLQPGEAGTQRLGLKFKSLGPYEGEAFAYRQLKEEAEERSRQERQRLHYVAMTRAKRRLILCGSAPLDQGAGDSPLGWVLDRLPLGWDQLPAEGACQYSRLKLEPEGIALGLTLCRDGAAFNGEDEADAAAGPVDAEPAIAPAVLRLPPAERFVPAVLSPTALDGFRACPRRYYLQSLLKAGSFLTSESSPIAAAISGLSATQMGTLVHALLEEIELPASRPEEALLDRLTRQLLGPDFRLLAVDRERALWLTNNLTEAPVAARLAQAQQNSGLERELPFQMLLGSTIIQGKIDAFCADAEGALVVDYKTGAVEPESLEESVAAYDSQVKCYALAAARRCPGQPVEVALVFLSRPGLERRWRFGADQIAGLAAELLQTIGAIGDSAFEPLPQLDPHQCLSCPGGQGSVPYCPVFAAR